MFVWRCNEWALSEIMQRVLRFCDDKQVWHTNSPSDSVAKIFTDKDNINSFIDLVILLLDEDRQLLVTNILKLVDLVRPVFEDLWGKGKSKIAPMDEVTAYSNMIACASHDWRQLKTAVSVLIKDKSVGHKLFYRYLNKVGVLANRHQISVVSAFRDAHERSVLTMEVGCTSQMDGDKMWLDTLSNDFDFTEYCKNKIIVGKAAKEAPISLISNTTVGGRVTGQGGVGNGGGVDTKRQPLPGDKRVERRGSIAGWIAHCKTNLNAKHRQVFGDGRKYCAAYHMTNMICRGTDPNTFKCVRGQYKRLHTCVCGVQGHPMHGCNRIW